MKKTLYAKVRCLCGTVLSIPNNKARHTCHVCHAKLRLVETYDTDGPLITPWAGIPENSLTQRIASGKRVKFVTPEITGWLWKKAK